MARFAAGFGVYRNFNCSVHPVSHDLCNVTALGVGASLLRS